MPQGHYWPKFTSHTTTIKQRAAERKARMAERQQQAQSHTHEYRAACAEIMDTTLDGGPVNPTVRAWAADRVNRRYSLRPRSW